MPGSAPGDTTAITTAVTPTPHPTPHRAGVPPLEAAKAAALKQLRPVIPHRLPPALRSLISSCWHPDPTQRPPARTVCDTLEELFPPQELSEAAVVGEGCSCTCA